MKLTANKATKEFIREGGGTNRFVAVNEAELTLEGGGLTVLTGRSGSGKTTLLNMLSGLLAPSSGSILLDDKDIYSLSDRALSRLRNESFGVIPQGQTAIQSLNVLENILLPVTLYTSAKEQDISYAKELTQQLDIAHLETARPAELSGGELRRVAIARAVIKRPGIIFADEPTGDLDDDNTKTVFEFLRAAADEGAAVLIVTHEGVAKDYADRVFTMSKGVLEAV